MKKTRQLYKFFQINKLMKENKILNKKLKVLCVCTRGMNRSKYLAKYLEGRGYSNRAGGFQPFKDSNKS
jgi:rhodanese-related sulfurtransferase